MTPKNNYEQKETLMKKSLRAATVPALTALLMIGCATTAPTKLTVTEPFDAANASRVLSDGPNTVSGSGLFRQKGGSVAHCGGESVLLIPATAYAAEIMQELFSSTSTGDVDLYELDRPWRLHGIREHVDENYADIDTDFWRMSRTTQCDAQGMFAFDKVPDGDYFLVITIIWDSASEGGTLMTRASVSDGETVRVVLSP